MNLDTMRFFLRAIDEKSISKAAQMEHITQSALTQHIKRLELDLKCQLINRSNRGVTPTEYGLLVYEYAKQLIDLQDSMTQRLLCMTEGCFNVVIKPCCSLNNSIMANVIFSLQSEHKNAKFDLVMANKDKIISEIKIGLTDFGIVMGEFPYDPEIEVNTVGKEQVVLISGLKLIQQDKISFKDLEKYKIVDFSLGSYAKELHRIIATNTKNDKMNGYTPFLSIDSISAIKSLIENNVAIAFLPLFAVHEEINNGRFKMIEVESFCLELPIKILSKPTSEMHNHLKTIHRNLLKKAIKAFIST